MTVNPQHRLLADEAEPVPAASYLPMKPFTLMLSCLLFFASASAAAKTSFDYIPRDAALSLTVDIKEDDSGQKWVIDSLIHYLISEAGGKKESAKVGEIKIFKFSDLSFALLPKGKGEGQQMLLAARLLPSGKRFAVSYGDKVFQLNIRDEEKADAFQKDLLHIILGIVCGVPAGSEPDGEVFYNPQAEARERFSAFYAGEEVAMMASNKGIVKAALAGREGMSSSPDFKRIADLLPKGWDAYGYARHESIPLADSRGRRWQRFIFALLSGVKRMGLALDVLDKDNSLLILVLEPEDSGKAGVLRERLEPTLDAMIKQFLDEEIKSVVTWEELPGAVRVKARLSNTYPFWTDIFHLGPAEKTPAETPEGAFRREEK